MQDRQIILTRVIPAPAAKIWRCWTDPALLPQWFGPEGYHCTTKDMDLREGGFWIFDMIGPDGKVWPNRHRYTLMTAPSRIEFLMDDGEGSTESITVIVELVPEAGGTRITQTMTFPNAEMAAGAKAFGAEALGQTTLAKLEAVALAE